MLWRRRRPLSFQRKFPPHCIGSTAKEQLPDRAVANPCNVNFPICPMTSLGVLQALALRATCSLMKVVNLEILEI